MNKHVLWITGATSICWMLGASGAYSPTPDWEGPACKVGAASFVVCSQEPAVPDDPAPCYVSHFANYDPDPIQLRLIKICQAAKAALGASSAKRSDVLTAVTSQAMDLRADINDHPDDASKNNDAIQAVGHDLVSLGSRMSAWGLTPSPDTWQQVTDSLDSLTTDAEVWGG